MNNKDSMLGDPIIRNALFRIREAEMGNGGELSALPDTTVLAMSYVPFQTNTNMYDIAEGFTRGTVFPELDKPFLGGKCK